MKKCFILLLMIGATTLAFGQATKVVKGAVIDTNGNPLPGAKVEATGGAESTVTDVDGTFSIEVSQWLKSLSVTYPGMDKKRMSIKSDNRDLIFTMKEKSKYWFVSAVGQYDFGYGNAGAGLMFGRLGKWGWYGKVMMDLSGVESDKIYYGHYEAIYNSVLGEYEQEWVNDGYEKADPGPSVSVGVIKRITPPLYGYLGIGYGTTYDKEFGEDAAGYLSEIGLIYRTNHLSISGGLSFRTEEYSDLGIGLHIGVGYVF